MSGSTRRRQREPSAVDLESVDGRHVYCVDGTTNAPGPLLRQPVAGSAPVEFAGDAGSFGFDVIDGGVP